MAQDMAETAAPLLRPFLKQVAQWERSLALQNPAARIDSSLVDFVLTERLDNGTEHEYPGSDVTLDFVESGGEWKNVFGTLVARNHAGQTVHVVLAYFSDAYGIYTLKNEPLEAGGHITLWEGRDVYITINDDGRNETLDIFTLIVSTEKVDDFLLTLDNLDIGAIVPRPRSNPGSGSLRTIPLTGQEAKATRKMQKNEWFTTDIRVRLVRRRNPVSVTDAALANGRIVVKGHPSVTADISLSAATSGGRGAGGGSDFYNAFERQGMKLLTCAVAGTRGENESVLEITGIQAAATLNDAPLEIQLNVPLEDNEGILPLVYDGRHVTLGGDSFKDEDGTTHIHIDHIPEVADNLTRPTISPQASTASSVLDSWRACPPATMSRVIT